MIQSMKPSYHAVTSSGILNQIIQEEMAANSGILCYYWFHVVGVRR